VPTELNAGQPWWRDAVVYQVYVRSFADCNGDGTGDLAGVLDRLPYLRELGVDALWFSPWYPSPMADSGYDVADYRAIDPLFGSLQQAEELITRALDLGIRTIVDVVPNHVSDQHEWFRAALAAAPGSPERARFWFRPGLHDGEQPPNGWQSMFGGPAWTRTKDADGVPGEWYLHLFAPEQPDLNWTHAEVWHEHEDVLRFWFDRGVAGIRIDSAALLIKDPELRDDPDPETGEQPFTDRDELHDVYRGWRLVADSYPEPRVLVGEVWLPDAARFARYLRADELHTAFNFDFLACPWKPASLRASIDTTLAAHAPVDAPATWVLANHDVTRTATRYGRADTSFSFEAKREGTPTDLALGTRRARAAALLTMALPGSLYIYQGEELGLPEVDVPAERREDPMYFRSGGVDPGRDGCRVPLPWSGDRPPYGFSPDGARATWLDQPADWAALSVAAQSADPDSMLSLYRAGLQQRRRRLAGADAPFEWIATPPSVLAFRRGPRFACYVNFGSEPVDLPSGASVLVTSHPLEGGRLPTDASVWLDQASQ
jgi:alpha-glucosidase